MSAVRMTTTTPIVHHIARKPAASGKGFATGGTADDTSDGTLVDTPCSSTAWPAWR
jgi:hypothetical protein